MLGFSWGMSSHEVSSLQVASDTSHFITHEREGETTNVFKLAQYSYLT